MKDESILLTIKKMLGLDPDYKAFDVDIITHINTTFATLQQIGVGPEDGFVINGEDETWFWYLQGDKRLESVKTYIYLKVRMLFDPPANSNLANALTSTASELEWRLNFTHEETK